MIRNRHKVRHVFSVLIKAVLTVGVICTGFAAGFAVVTLMNAPDLNVLDVAPDGYRSVVLDDAGEEMVKLVGAESNRVYVTLDKIPQDLVDAVVAIEDERFWDHCGIDLRGIARALYINVISGSVSQGASTITQQLIKNNVFAVGMGEDTMLDKVQRKLQEQYLALKLENQVEKTWILENYLNTINLGGGTWGVSTAAQRYFGKEVGELTLSECAVLAGITKSPSYYNPLKNPDNNAIRRQLVLDKMLELGNITQVEYDEAMADAVYERIKENSISITQDVFSYFEDAMITQLAQDLQTELGMSEDGAWQLLYRGGLTIYATQDTDLQMICESAINDSSRYSDDQQATVVVMDPYTGQVKAIVGGRGEKAGSLTWNRATSSVRQPGSAIKVVAEYAAALEEGTATLGTVYDDAPYTYSNGTTIRNANGSYAGRITVREGITSSNNIVALQCFQKAGMDNVWKTLEAFGFEHLTDADRVEALALGGTNGGVTNLELTAAYSALANGGEYIQPSYYIKVLDREGKILLEKEPERREVVSGSTATLLTQAMTGVLTTGTGTQAYFSGMPLAGKSGTTTNARDVWFVGYSPYYACGVWGGYDDNSAQSGSGYVKKLWRDIMREAHQGFEARDFTMGEEMVECSICTKCGNLAVMGVCDSSVQGDMTCREYFLSGTEPTQSCSCHIAVRTCTISGEQAGSSCPNSQIETKVYLISGTVGTADAEAVCPQMASTTCSYHDRWWDWLFPWQNEPEYYVPEPNPEPEPEPYSGYWWTDPSVNWYDPSSWLGRLQQRQME